MPNSKTIRILYMEDDAGLARLLQKRLQREGYVIDTACNGEEGLAMFDEGEYDVVLVDYEMPVCGGLDVIRTLSSQKARTPTIMVTGNGNERIAVQAIKLGAADYIVKDVEMAYLELLPIVIDNVFQKDQLVKEKQKMLQAIKESEERYRRLVELSPDGIAIHIEGEFVFVNPAGEKLLGASKSEQLLGQSLLDFIHSDHSDMVTNRVKDLQKEATILPWTEEKLIRVDGTEINVEMAGVPFRYKGKQAEQVIFRDITERKLAEERLEYLALYDSLTGLHSRNSFFDHLGRLLAQAKRYHRILALLFLDLDRFKLVNDTLGHDMGDMLLKEVANRLKDCLRASDVPARMGGDEFSVILAEIANAQDASIIAGRIIASLNKPFRIEDNECSIGVSVGISQYPADSNDPETLLKNADSAMYNAKKLGGDNFQFFSLSQST
jgi:diguanylate cyclase (GGDEF)-like protein/PAS domain S-box-containing protein